MASSRAGCASCWKLRGPTRRRARAPTTRDKEDGLSKLRVHDMAGEFGILAEEMIALLRSMEVPVRSHLTELSDDQVSRIRARWEREKRARVAKQNAPAAPAARRRRTVAPEPEPVAASAAAPAVRRRRASEVTTH